MVLLRVPLLQNPDSKTDNRLGGFLSAHLGFVKG